VAGFSRAWNHTLETLNEGRCREGRMVLRADEYCMHEWIDEW
jgi:hypothetical protein